jgi:hypothetical protein
MPVRIPETRIRPTGKKSVLRWVTLIVVILLCGIGLAKNPDIRRLCSEVTNYQPTTRQNSTPLSQPSRPLSQEAAVKEESPPPTAQPEESQTQTPQPQVYYPPPPPPPTPQGTTIKVNTGQNLPSGTKLQVLAYDNNGNNPREARIVSANQNNSELEIKLEESFPDGTQYKVNWYTPQMAQQQPMPMPPQMVQQPPMLMQPVPLIGIPTARRLNLRHR